MSKSNLTLKTQNSKLESNSTLKTQNSKLESNSTLKTHHSKLESNSTLKTHHSKLLITGGAGYIGSHLVKQLLQTTDYELVVLDNLVTGFNKTIQTLQKIKNFKFINQDLKEWDKVEKILNEEKFDTIVHFAASLIVPESMENPAKYYLNNTANTRIFKR